MGADGGVCWLQVRDLDRFKELVPHYMFTHFNDYHDGNWEWMEANANPSPDPNGIHYVYATHGTDQDLCLLDLFDLLGEIDEVQSDDCDWVHIGLRDLSFGELGDDWNTRQEYYKTSWWVLDRLAELWSPDWSEPPDRVKDMKLVDWAVEMRDILVPGSGGEIETWT